MIKVKITVMAFLYGKAVNRQFDWETEEGKSLKKLFSELDRNKVIERGYFKRIFSLSRPPTLLINGDRIEPGASLKAIRIKDGDEISVLMPIAGGNPIFLDF